MNVFTYGSLMFPDVWERVVRGRYRAVRAVADGHARFAIDGETYPGMVPAAGGSVEGVLYIDVDAADLAALDAFEGADYRRDTIRVGTDHGSVDAATYIYLRSARLLDRPWEPDAFQKQRFLDSYCRERLGS